MILIVESPGKTKKIESLVGCKCYASMGHIMDLEKNFVSKFDPNNIDPKYCVLPDKKKTVANLKNACKGKANEVYIASDGDREGEAIAHDLISILGLSISRTKRIVFHEISKNAILKAINNPGRLDVNAYNAQQARRVIDIIFGYTISPLLWKYVEGRLSAGRCQSPTVKLIVDKQTQVENHTVNNKKIKASCEVSYNKKKIQLECCEEITTFLSQEYSIAEERIDVWIEEQLEKKYTYLLDKKEKQRKENPKDPLTTSTLQQVVYNSHGIQPKECMQIAQKLYENGFISYHRTDSTFLSEEFTLKAKEYAEKKYGSNYVAPPIDVSSKQKKQTIKSKKVVEQAAHEAIRPIEIENFPTDKDSIAFKVYMKIWNYAIGSIMSNAVFKDVYLYFGDKNTHVSIWSKKIVSLEHEGYLILFGKKANSDEIEDDTLIKAPLKEEFSLENINVKEHAESPPKPYTPASLIKTLENTGIGRPSTYSTIISKVLNKNYAQLGESKIIKVVLKQWNYDYRNKTRSEFEHKMGGHKNVYIATELGIRTNTFLDDACSFLIQPKFTEEMERQLDSVAQGNLVWTHVVADFYEKMKKSIHYIPKKYENITDNVEKNLSYSIPWVKKYKFKSKINDYDNIEIGEIKGKFGIVLAKSICGKIVKFSPYPPHTKLSDFKDDEIINIFKYPKNIGIFNGEKMLLCLGKKGWYLELINSFKLKVKVHTSDKRSVPSKEIIKNILNNLKI
jgi:DNA topoisomerase-1